MTKVYKTSAFEQETTSGVRRVWAELNESGEPTLRLFLKPTSGSPEKIELSIYEAEDFFKEALKLSKLLMPAKV